jgi:lysozyme
MADTVNPAPQVRAKGIDVSHDDGPVDWPSVLGAGVSFAFAKASEGNGFTDPEFAANWRGMGEAGITRGAYLFWHPAQSPASQVARFWSVVQAAGGLTSTDMPPVIDVEVTDGLPRRALCAALHETVEALTAISGRSPILYVSPGFAAGSLDDSFGDLHLWVADYGPSEPTLPAGWSDWLLWQYAAGEAGGHPVPGVGGAGKAGSVDVSVANGDHAWLLGHLGIG